MADPGMAGKAAALKRNTAWALDGLAVKAGFLDHPWNSNKNPDPS